MSRLPLITVLVVFLCLAHIGPLTRNPWAGQVSDRKQSTDPAAFVPIGSLAEEHTFQAYTIRMYWDPIFQKGGSFEILQRGRRVYSSQGWKFWIGGADKTKASVTPIGKNITGNGIPNLVISEFSGSAHCCFETYVFEIGSRFREIPKLGAVPGHSGGDFIDVDGDGILEFVTDDGTFAYWRTSYADSPAPQVILRYRNGTYRMAGDLMRKPAPMALTTRARQIQRGRWSEPCLDTSKYPCPPSSLWGTMLALLYSGHAALAWQFFDTAWPPGIKGKDTFLTDFRTQLTQSPYWPDVQALSQTATTQAKSSIADINPPVREQRPTVGMLPRTAPAAEEIPLTRVGGVYELPVEINGVLTLKFILDSGAAEVHMPADMVSTLMRTGTIQDTDFLPGKTYSLADGSTIKSPRFILRTVKIGSRRLQNIPASVGSLQSALLRGQSVLETLGTWGIDSQKQILIIGSVGRKRP